VDTIQGNKEQNAGRNTTNKDQILGNLHCGYGTRPLWQPKEDMGIDKTKETRSQRIIPGEAWINYFKQMFDEDETQHQEKPAMAEATTRIIHELVEKYTKELKN